MNIDKDHVTCFVMDAVEGKNKASRSDLFWQIQIFLQNHSDFLSLESGRSGLISQENFFQLIEIEIK